MTHDVTTVSAIPVELAREPDFWLGALQVRPSICQVVSGSDPIDLQPKIMKVLVALSRAQGRVVSLEDLLAFCWGNVVVGDGSVHRCVARLRRLSMDEAPGNFSIVSQAKVGYRLVAHDTGGLQPGVDIDEVNQAPRAPTVEGFARGRTIIVSVAAILFLGLIVALVALAWPTRPAYRIAVRDFKTEGVASEIGGGMADRVAAAVSDRDLPTVARTRSSRGDFDGARFIVGGDIQRVGDQIKVNVELDDASSGLTLWTHTVSRSSSEADALQDQVASKVADVMALTRSWIGPHGDAAKPEVLAAVFKATDLVRGLSPTILQTREAFRRFRDLAPESSGAHSAYAMATVLGSYNQTSEVALQWRTEAASEARRAIDLDPKNGEGYLASGLLTPDSDLAMREHWFLKGLGADPNNSSLANFLGDLLLAVGRVDDGVIWIDRSTKLDPLSSPKTRSLVNAFAIAGRFGDADRLIERSNRLWPEDIRLRRLVLFRSLIYSGPAQALEALDRYQGTDKPLPPDRALVWRDFEKVRAGALSAETIEKRLAVVNSSSGKEGFAANKTLTLLGSDELNALICALASLGDRDDAFRILDTSRSMHIYLDPSVLFEPATKSIRSDPRFTQVAANLDLVRYWTQTKRKPDFCAQQPTATVCL